MGDLQSFLKVFHLNFEMIIARLRSNPHGRIRDKKAANWRQKNSLMLYMEDQPVQDSRRVVGEERNKKDEPEKQRGRTKSLLLPSFFPRPQFPRAWKAISLLRSRFLGKTDAEETRKAIGHPVNTARFLWPVGERINRVPLN